MVNEKIKLVSCDQKNMKTLLPLLTIILLLEIFGCTDPTTSNNNATTPTSQTDHSTPAATRTVEANPNLEDLIKKGKAIDFENFNKTIIEGQEAKTEWVNSPFQIALKFTNDQLESRSKKIEVQSENAENQDNVFVTIREDGLLDDSVQSSMVILKMNKKEDLWQIQEAKQVWKCWEGRGHKTFNSQPCK